MGLPSSLQLVGRGAWGKEVRTPKIRYPNDVHIMYIWLCVYISLVGWASQVMLSIFHVGLGVGGGKGKSMPAQAQVSLWRGM